MGSRIILEHNEEKHALVRQRNLTRSGWRAPAHQGHGARAVVGGAGGALAPMVQGETTGQ